MHSSTSATLLGRMASGADNNANWTEFVGRYGPQVLNWCRQQGCPESDLEDALQEVLIKLLKAFASFQYDPNKSFRAWLSVVTRNAVADIVRSPQSRIRGHGGDTYDSLAQVPAADDLENALHAEFQQELLQQASLIVREQVKPATWQSYELIEIRAMSPVDAAAQLQMPVEHVYVAKSRVIARLRAEVAKIQEEFDGELR